MNRTQINKQLKENPVEKANFVSKWTFWWLRNLFKSGLNKPLAEEELYQTKKDLKADRSVYELENIWNQQLKKKNPSLIKALFIVYTWRVIPIGLIFSICESIMRVGQPLFLGGLLSYFVPGQNIITRQDAYLYAAGIIFCSLIPVLTFHPFILHIYEKGTQMRLACTGLLYKKILRLSKSSAFDGLCGRVITLMSNDCGKFDIVLCFIHDLWKGPFEALLLGYFIYREIGISGIIGMAFLLSFIPFQAWIAKKSAEYRLKTAKRTDLRVRLMNEIIQGMQVIKMYAWEQSFAAHVEKIRKKEINAIRGTSYIQATLHSFYMIAKLSLFLSLVSYILLGEVITARKVFIVSSYFNILNLSMMYFWPVAISTVAEGYVSVKRIQEFLLESEEKPTTLNIIDDQHMTNENIDKKSMNNYRRKNVVKAKFIDMVKDSDAAINLVQVNRYDEANTMLTKNLILDNVTAVWELNSENSTNPGIYNINLKIEPGNLCGIIGQVGSGKSTLLNVIAGEVAVDSGTMTVNGRVSFATQEPWLFEGSVKDNIIFVEEFDPLRYNEVVKVCALDRDFEQLPYGENTIVGEKGISLSGGQRARVNLARAIYRKADIYLLDDPLSAVDSQVGKHLFEKCIKEYLFDKICVLVTHQLQHLKDVKHVVLMNDGRIESQGTYKEIKSSKSQSMLTKLLPDQESDKEKIDKELKKLSECDMTKEIEDIDERQETQAVGAVSLKIYAAFIKSIEAKWYVTFVATMFILAQLAVSGIDYYLSLWANWEEKIAVDSVTKSAIIEEDAISATRENYIIFYSILMAVAVYIFIHRSFAFAKLCLRASTKLHNKLFLGITRTKMLFFNKNPSGRILNRFSKDIHAIDLNIPNTLSECLAFFLQFFSVMVIVAIVNYWLLIPTAVMSIIFYVIRTIYINTARSIKRIEALARSPIYSHTNATLQGLSVVRVFKAQDTVEREFYEHLDFNTASWYLFVVTTRAFAFWLDIVCVIYIAIVTLSFLVLTSIDTKSGTVGLAILQCIDLVGMCQWGMRQTAELENEMTSVERVIEYTNLPVEATNEPVKRNLTNTDWPNQGQIEFKNLNLRYEIGRDIVLNNLNFTIRPQEKIGIVGRTGAGKSSIIQALFRLAENEGAILIDSIDINTIELQELRRKISIIPQDPILFSGSLRHNLDPFNEKTDEDLWSALSQVELRPIVMNMAGGLDTKMSDGGANFSMGQRQLICLARAVLRNNKILVMDEATANVDPDTDQLIQKTIKTKFEHCTVLTIAHRLHTVMESDRILVIDSGRAVEFGHPFELLQNSNGYLQHLVNQTGFVTSELLKETAENSYNKTKRFDIIESIDSHSVNT